MATFTNPLSAGYDPFLVSNVMELWITLQEKMRTYSRADYAYDLSAVLSEPTSGNDAHSQSWWNTFQTMMETNCTRFYDYTQGDLEGQPFVTSFGQGNYNLQTWRVAAGLNLFNGFRRVTSWDGTGIPAWQYGKAQVGDIFGYWIYEDIQKGLDAMRWVNCTTTWDNDTEGSGSASSTVSWAAALAAAQSNWNLFAHIPQPGQGWIEERYRPPVGSNPPVWSASLSGRQTGCVLPDEFSPTDLYSDIRHSTKFFTTIEEAFGYLPIWTTFNNQGFLDYNGNPLVEDVFALIDELPMGYRATENCTKTGYANWNSYPPNSTTPPTPTPPVQESVAVYGYEELETNAILVWEYSFTL